MPMLEEVEAYLRGERTAMMRQALSPLMQQRAKVLDILLRHARINDGGGYHEMADECRMIATLLLAEEALWASRGGTVVSAEDG